MTDLQVFFLFSYWAGWTERTALYRQFVQSVLLCRDVLDDSGSVLREGLVLPPNLVGHSMCSDTPLLDVRFITHTIIVSIIAIWLSPLLSIFILNLIIIIIIFKILKTARGVNSKLTLKLHNLLWNFVVRKARGSRIRECEGTSARVR